MVLIDTSSWIHFLRPDGDSAVRARVDGLLRRAGHRPSDRQDAMKPTHVRLGLALSRPRPHLRHTRSSMKALGLGNPLPGDDAVGAAP